MKLIFTIWLFPLFILAGSIKASSPVATIEGLVSSDTGGKLAYASVVVSGTNIGTTTDDLGHYVIEGIPEGQHSIQVSYIGYETYETTALLKGGDHIRIDFNLEPSSNMMDEIVVTGTLKEVSRLESPVPVEIYRPTFFKKNPTPNIYEALQNVNGVRPQLNCQVCNTGDIHINGLEGPYTMVLIDGMPIVSSLATVYGLSGIPSSLIERMEIVKGPASSLYGSEAIGGLINIITKKPGNAPIFSADIMGTTWSEWNADIGVRFKVSDIASSLTGINYYKYDKPIDNNNDNFTDVTLQERISIFQKWNFNRKDNRLFTLAARYYSENRWGGEMDWTPAYRGGDEIYGEAITTKRWELIGQYQLPTVDNMIFSLSLNSHKQNSVYGDLPYLASQKIGFSQLTWDKTVGKPAIQSE